MSYIHCWGSPSWHLIETNTSHQHHNHHNIIFLFFYELFLVSIHTSYRVYYHQIPTEYQIIIGIDNNSQYNSRGSHLRSQLSSVITMLPTVQMHLILCTFFTSTANKHEFITMAYQLIDRLAALSHLTYPLRYVENDE